MLELSIKAHEVLCAILRANHLIKPNTVREVLPFMTDIDLPIQF